MYVVKKAVSDSRYGRNDWKVIYTAPDKAGAMAVYKQEYRMLLETDPTLDREAIDRNVEYCYSTWSNRSEAWHGGTGFAMYKSQAAEHQVPAERPHRTEVLNSILG